MTDPVHHHPLAARVRAHHRVALAAVAGLSGGLATAALTSQSPWVGAWLIASGVYLALALHVLFTQDALQTRSSAQWDDPGTRVLAVLVPVLAWSSLAAVLHAAQGNDALAPIHRTVAVVLALASVGSAWLVIQASTAFHYARMYYQRDETAAGGRAGGLRFPGHEEPAYLDFLYFASVIGMTSQVSDIVITDRRMRRFAMVHGVTAFAFNVLVLAIVVNVLATSLPGLIR